MADDLPGCDRPAYRRTMARLAALDVGIVHAGHGREFGRDRMREIGKACLGAG